MNQRGNVLLYILIILLVIIAGGLGYYILNNQSQFNPTLSNDNSLGIGVPKKTPIASPSASPSLDTSGWKTYKDDYVSFSLPDRYGSGKPQPNTAITTLLEEINFTVKNDRPKLIIQITNDPAPLSELVDYYKATPTTINNQPAMRFLVLGGQAGDIYTPTIQANYNNRRYMVMIETINMQEDSNVENELTQIIKTFKFLK